MAEEIKPVYVFHYTPDGVFSGFEPAHESPREPGVYHVPYNATLKEPPITGANQYAWFNREADLWLIRERSQAPEAPAPKSWLERMKDLFASKK